LVDLDRATIRILRDDATAPGPELVILEQGRPEVVQRLTYIVQRVDIETGKVARGRSPPRGRLAHSVVSLVDREVNAAQLSGRVNMPLVVIFIDQRHTNCAIERRCSRQVTCEQDQRRDLDHDCQPR